MEIISRTSALKLNLPKYYTGKPCKKNHLCSRYVSNWACVQCHDQNTKHWKNDNREKVLSQYREYHNDNRERRNKEASIRTAKHQKDKPWLWAANKAKRKAQKRLATPSFADNEKIKLIYKQCLEITNSTGIPHHVDHIVPLISDEVCGLHVEWNLQILPASENAVKGNKLLPNVTSNVMP